MKTMQLGIRHCNLTAKLLLTTSWAFVKHTLNLMSSWTAVKEFQKVVEQAHPKSLVVIDYYRTACGACKYILPGFVKLCKRSGSHESPVIFLKHNVIDEYGPSLVEIDMAFRNQPICSPFAYHLFISFPAAADIVNLQSTASTYASMSPSSKHMHKSAAM